MRKLLTLLCLLSLTTATGRAQPPGQRPPGDRQALEKRFRDRLAAVIRERLSLNDDQMARLTQLNGSFEEQRRALFVEEIEVRRGMRQAMQSESPSDSVVAPLLNRAVRLQRRRVELLEAEHRELEQFLSPVQHAKYFGMQEQLRRQMEEMRARREGEGDVPAGPGRGMRRPRRPPGG